MVDLFGNELVEPVERRRRGTVSKPEIVRRSMTERERKIIGALSHVSFGLCRSMGRFAKDMERASKEAEPAITDKQARYLSILAWRYRRQINSELAYPMSEEEIAAYAIDLRGRA